MKINTRKFVAVLCTFFMLFTSSQAYAASITGAPLHEIYPYAEDFEYQDTIIAHALKSTVVKVVMNYSADLKYTPVQFDPDLLEKDLVAKYRQYGSNYSSTDEFVIAFIEHAQQNITDYLIFGTPTTTLIEGTFVGSGVVIDEDGYIATNSHVVTIDDRSKALIILESLSNAILEDLARAKEALSEYSIELTDEQAESLYEQIVLLMTENFTVTDEESNLEVWFPAADGNTSMNAATKYAATTVAEGNSSSTSEKGLTEDSAILKIDAENLVALNLSDSYPDLSTHITAAGFPSASDNIFQNIGSAESVMSVTVTSGTVSRLISIEGFEQQAIEITATISPGNSGGPSVDNHLKIEGLNTYMNSEDNRYAYMIPAAYVNELASNIEPEQGNVSKTFLLGLQMLQQGYGKTALECFEYVREMQPDTPYIDSLIKTAKAAPQKACMTKTQTWILIIAIAGSVLLLIGGLIVLLIVKKKKKLKKTTVERVEPIAPTTPVVPTKPSTISSPTPRSSGYISVAPVTPVTPKPATPTNPYSRTPSYTPATPVAPTTPPASAPTPAAAPTPANPYGYTSPHTPGYAPAMRTTPPTPTPTPAPAPTPAAPYGYTPPRTPGYSSTSEATVSLTGMPPSAPSYTPPTPTPASSVRYSPPKHPYAPAPAPAPESKPSSFDSAFKPGSDL